MNASNGAAIVHPDAETLGRHLARARADGGRVAADLPGPRSREEAEAIQVQAVLAYGRAAEGWGVSAGSNRCARLLGCEVPVCAPLFAGDRVESGGRLPVNPTLIGAGVELVFRFGRSFPDRDDDPADLAAIRDAIVACHVGLQVLGRRLAATTALDSWAATADFGLAAHHARGPAVGDGWRRADLKGWPMRLGLDGNDVAAGHAGEIFGEPLAAVSWLATTLRGRGALIEAGSFVATGSCTGLVHLVPGQIVAGHAGPAGCPGVRLVTT